MNKLCAFLLFIDFVTVLFPQPGYIHPDEFFQSTEIVAGDVLNIKHVRAWEFNDSSPIRSVVFPYILLSPSFYLLKWLNTTGLIGSQITAVKIVIASRLPFTFLSLLGYYATEKLANSFEIFGCLSATLYCSSYVTWTYFTRTFSNSVEAVLLAITIILTLSCVDCKVYQNKMNLIIKHKLYFDPKEINKPPNCEEENDYSQKTNLMTAETVNVSKAKNINFSKDQNICIFRKLHLDEIQDENIKLQVICRKLHSNVSQLKLFQFILGFIVLSGFFNRPTFLAFAIVPIIFLFYILNSIKNISKCLFFMSFGALIGCSLFIFLDSIYYNPDFKSTLNSCINIILNDHLSIKSFFTSIELFFFSLIITPWNFVKYNMDSGNLAAHGLHPYYTHFLVNLPLIIGPLYFPFLFGIVSSAFSKNTAPFSFLWLSSMALVPVFLLSVFPHQEPRFLIPALPIYLVMAAKIISTLRFGKRVILITWAAFNLALVIVYGYMHQAALIPTLSNYQLTLSSSPATHHSAIFCKTYPPPHHLLIIDSAKTNVRIHDLAGASINILMDKVRTEVKKCQDIKAPCQVSIFLPSTVSSYLVNLISDYKLSITSICPHLSMEAPPRLKSWWENKIYLDDLMSDFCLSIINIR